MKSLYKYAFGATLVVFLSLTFAPAAEGQRGAHSGGVHVSGGSGGGARGGFGLGLSILRGGISLAFRGAGAATLYAYPSVGFHLGVLPLGYYPFYFGADLFYYSGGVFYRPYDDGGYEVTTPPVGAAVPGLPKDAESIVIDGQQYYRFSGVYYQQSSDDQGKTVFVIAGKDGVLNTNGQSTDNPPRAPQVGDITNELPEDSRKIKLNGKSYFVAPDGIYYEEFTDTHNTKAYRIVSIPTDGDLEKQDY